MLEYPIEGAEELLRKNLSQAESTLRQVGEDLDYITDQCTTLEVGILSLLLVLVPQVGAVYMCSVP